MIVKPGELYKLKDGPFKSFACYSVDTKEAKIFKVQKEEIVLVIEKLNRDDYEHHSGFILLYKEHRIWADERLFFHYFEPVIK